MPHYIFIPDCNTLLPSTEARYVVTHHGQPSLQTVDANGTLDRYLATQTNTADGETIIVIPLSRIAFIDALLPRVSAQKRNQLVNFAIEDKLTIDPSTMHVVVIGPSLTGANRHIIAAISRPWLLSVTTWLQQAGVSYRTVLPETALFRVLPDEWLVILDGSKQGMAIRSDGLAYALDADNDSKPPFQLTLALNEAVAAESGHAVPTTLRLRLVGSAPGEKTIDCDRWQQCLGKQIPIILERRDAMANVPDDIPVSRLKESNLLVGQFLPAGRGTSAIKALKPAWILGSVILFLHVLFVSVDAWQLDHQRRQIESAMRQQFLSSFPEATTIVDPALQMSRNLAALKIERGLANDPVRDMLAEAAAMTKALPENVVADISLVSVSTRTNSQTLTISFANLSNEKQALLHDAASRASLRFSAPRRADVVRNGSHVQLILTSGGQP